MSTEVILRQLPWLASVPARRETDEVRARPRFKHCMDLALIIASLPLLVPTFLVCIAALKLESPRAPVFFAQKRAGWRGRPFRMLKFRTMVPNAEELKQ